MTITTMMKRNKNPINCIDCIHQLMVILTHLFVSFTHFIFFFDCAFVNIRIFRVYKAVYFGLIVCLDVTYYG